MQVSIVVPTFDGGDMLLRALEHVEAGSSDVELIIVDNGSTDGSVERARERFPNARVLRNEHNTGFAPACNQGADEAHTDFVLFLNDDAFMTRRDLDTLIAAARGDPSGAIWQPVNYDRAGDVDSAGELFNWTGIFVHGTEVPAEPLVSVFATKGPALLVRTSDFRDLGGFRADYFAYLEETDLCWRARLAGREVRLVTTASVRHIGGQTTARVLASEDIRYLSFRNRLRTILADAGAGTLAVMAPLHVLACLGFALAYALTARFGSAGSVLKALGWTVGNHDVWRAQRAETQAARRAADRDVMRRELRGRFTPAVLWRQARGHLSRWEDAAATAGSDPR
jgi:GT2 family glycosyltransferase